MSKKCVAKVAEQNEIQGRDSLIAPKPISEATKHFLTVTKLNKPYMYRFGRVQKRNMRRRLMQFAKEEGLSYEEVKERTKKFPNVPHAVDSASSLRHFFKQHNFKVYGRTQKIEWKQSREELHKLLGKFTNLGEHNALPEAERMLSKKILTDYFPRVDELKGLHERVPAELQAEAEKTARAAKEVLESEAEKAARADKEELEAESEKAARAAKEELEAESEKAARAAKEELEAEAEKAARAAKEELEAESEKAARAAKEELEAESEKAARAAKEELQAEVEKAARAAKEEDSDTDGM